MYSFLALDAKKVAAQNLDATEEIEVYPTPVGEVIRMARDGELLQALHVSALFLALVHMGRVK